MPISVFLGFYVKDQQRKEKSSTTTKTIKTHKQSRTIVYNIWLKIMISFIIQLSFY